MEELGVPVFEEKRFCFFGGGCCSFTKAGQAGRCTVSGAGTSGLL